MFTEKTFKREIAFLMFVWLCYVSVFGSLAVLEVIVWPCFIFISGAYGLDAYYKNDNVVPFTGSVREPEPPECADR